MNVEANTQFAATLKAYRASKDAVPVAQTHILLNQEVTQTKS